MLTSPQEYPKVSVVIPTRNRAEKLARCVGSVLRCDYPRMEVTVVDDCSDYDVAAQLRGLFPSAKVVRNSRRRLLAHSRNVGAMSSSGDYIFFLDDDNQVAPDVLTQLVAFLVRHESIAVCMPVIYLLGQPGETWTTFISKGSFPGFFRLGHSIPASPTRTWAFHDAFMVKRSFFLEIGGFDEVNFPIHFSEMDFAYRIREKGYEAAVIPSARIWLEHGGKHMHVDSTRAFYTVRNKIILMKKHEPAFKVAVYLAYVPVLTTYYLLHHTRNATDGALRTSFSLIRGVVAGLRYRAPGR